jgi:hypothetical protein
MASQLPNLTRTNICAVTCSFKQLATAIVIDRQGQEEWLGFEFGLASPSRLAVISRLGWKVNLGQFGAAPGGTNQRQLGGDLDAAAAFRVEAGVEDVGGMFS